MIITKTFIMLNLPKTGSTFARNVIKKIYGEGSPGLLEKFLWMVKARERKVIDFQAKNIKVGNRNNKDQHGVYDQIPEEYIKSDREVVSIIRDPFTAYISRYNFESWRKHISKERVKIAKKEFPHYPDLKFSEYIDFINLEHTNRLQGIELSDNIKIGTLSLQFLQMFTKNHRELIGKIHENFIDDDSLKYHFPKIIFLKNENLNKELYDFLRKHGFSKEDVGFINEEGKKNVSTTDSYEGYLSNEIVNKILEWEWVLFKLFPEYKPENNSLIKK